MTTLKPTVVKKSISLSLIVSEWADALALKKGFGSNYSAYIADLIRRDKERDEEAQFVQASSETSSSKITKAADQIVDLIQEAARQKSVSPRRK
jgi:predicted alternative tryptophan synthase beta-subunit